MSARTEATRARILDAATREFAQHGFAGARMDRISKTAEANVQRIYAYYGGKEPLFEAVAATVMDGLIQAIDRAGPELQDIALAIYDHVDRDEDGGRFFTWARLQDPERIDAIIARFNPGVSPAIGRLSQLQQDGKAPSDLDAGHLCHIIVKLAEAARDTSREAGQPGTGRQLFLRLLRALEP